MNNAIPSSGPVKTGTAKGHIPATVMQRAAARILSVPAGPTLIDRIPDETWISGDDAGDFNVGRPKEA